MATAAAVPSLAELRHLYRALLREARKFPNYNVREYVKRRTMEEFRSNRSMTDPSEITKVYAHGQESLQIAKRQAVVYTLYAPRTKSIMDLKISEVSQPAQ